MLAEDGGGGSVFTPPQGSPGAIRAAAQQLSSHGTTAGDLGSSLRRSSQSLTSGGAWTGSAAGAFTLFAGRVEGLATGAEKPIGTISSGLSRYADALETAQRTITEAAARYDSASKQAAELVSATDSDASRTPAQVAAAQQQVDSLNSEMTAAEQDATTAWSTYESESQAVATELSAVATQAQADVTSSNVAEVAGGDEAESESWYETLLHAFGATPESKSGVDFGHWLEELGLKSFGTTTKWLTSSKYGVFQPRINGKFSSTNGMSFWQRTKAALGDDNWHAKPNAAELRNAWDVAGDVAEKGGTVVTGAVAGWDQWQKDSGNPDLDTTAKVTRATTAGVTTAAATWGGAELGGEAGMAIGTAVGGPVGTVVGGLVGGLVGGAAGAIGAGAANKYILDPVGKAADAVGSWTSGAVSSVAHSSVVHDLEPWHW